MNIGAIARAKLNDLMQAKPEDINQNFDRIVQDIRRLADALNAYQVDLSSSDDVTGILSTDNLDLSGLSQDFIAPFTTRRVFGRQNTVAAQFAIGLTDASFTDSNDGGATPDTVTAWRTFTPTTTGAKGGFDGPNLVRIGHAPRFRMYMKTGASLANLRFWFGFSSAGQTNVDTHAASCASIRYSTVASDTGWMGVCRDGTTQVVTSSNILGIAVSSIYLLDISVSAAGVVTFTVNNVTAGTSGSATLSTNLPLSTTNLQASCQLFTTENVAKSWLFSRFQVDAN